MQKSQKTALLCTAYDLRRLLLSCRHYTNGYRAPPVAVIWQASDQQNIDANQLILHSDNGGPMKGATMLATLQNLGVVPSFSRPRVSNDNPFSDSMFSTMKTAPAYPRKPFESVEAVEDWVAEFVHWYNNEHLHSGVQFVTPADRHHGKDREILASREEVYAQARQCNPSRWSTKTRDWSPVEAVHLNPEKLSPVSVQPQRKSA